MNRFLNSDIGRLRIIAFFEGMSFLILIGIAMPLKYFFNNPKPVMIVGQIHGLLFILFIAMALYSAFKHKWSFLSTTSKVLLSSFIPFGTFYIDAKILKNYHTN